MYLFLKEEWEIPSSLKHRLQRIHWWTFTATLEKIVLAWKVLLKQLCSHLLNLAVISTNQRGCKYSVIYPSMKTNGRLNDAHAELLRYCGFGGYVLTQVTWMSRFVCVWLVECRRLHMGGGGGTRSREGGTGLVGETLNLVFMLLIYCCIWMDEHVSVCVVYIYIYIYVVCWVIMVDYNI